MRKEKVGVSSKGISKKGSGVNIFDKELCDIIRKRLNLSEKELPNMVIKKVVSLQNREIAKWIVNNSEGYMLKNMGVIAVSKYLPKELRESKEDDIDKIKSIEINELRRKQLLARYNVDIGHRVNFQQLFEFQRLLPHVNLHSYFYIFKVMWFNQRNCKTKKALAYTFSACGELNRQLHSSVINGKEYYEWVASDFFRHKVRAKW